MRRRLLSTETIRERIDEAIRRSTADETSVSWLETREQVVDGGASSARDEAVVRRVVTVRVLDDGRVGSYVISGGDVGDLRRATRHAVAHATASDQVPGFRHLPHDDSPAPAVGEIHDDEVASLDPRRAGELLGSHLRDGESARLDWSDTRLVVASTRGLDRSSAATRLQLRVRCNGDGGHGSAAAAARRLGALDLERVFGRARHRTPSGGRVELEAEDATLALAPEAVAQLVGFLNRAAFTARTYERNESLLCRYRGVQVFDRSFELTDDATDVSGLPFPFDQEGSAKRRVALVERGVPRTPALDHLHAHLLGLEATAHATSVDDALAEHLFVGCGELSDREVLEAANGGVWAAGLDRLESYEPGRLHLRAVLTGARRVEGGRLGRALPDLRWETSLLESFGRVRGLGRAPVVVTSPASLFGGVSAPAVVFESERLSAL